MADEKKRRVVVDKETMDELRGVYTKLTKLVPIFRAIASRLPEDPDPQDGPIKDPKEEKQE